mgnify:CR=1 FL=1
MKTFELGVSGLLRELKPTVKLCNTYKCTFATLFDSLTSAVYSSWLQYFWRDKPDQQSLLTFIFYNFESFFFKIWHHIVSIRIPSETTSFFVLRYLSIAPWSFRSLYILSMAADTWTGTLPSSGDLKPSASSSFTSVKVSAGPGYIKEVSLYHQTVAVR